jgi:two-component system LytT family response regulator
MPIKAFIVDDEPLARARMRALLEEHAHAVDIIGEAANGEEALERIEDLMPDVVFLDIQMPEMDGFTVAAKLHAPPMLVFVTAYDEYALKAFEQHAVDYLLKPVAPERLALTLARVQELLQARQRRYKLPSEVEQLLLTLRRTYLKRITVTLGERTMLVNVQHIAYFSANNKYTLVHDVNGKHYVVSTSLTELEDKLDPDAFLRVHRSTIVNVDCIREIRKHDGKYTIVLNDKPCSQVDVGKTYTARISEL